MTAALFWERRGIAAKTTQCTGNSDPHVLVLTTPWAVMLSILFPFPKDTAISH